MVILKFKIVLPVTKPYHDWRPIDDIPYIKDLHDISEYIQCNALFKLFHDKPTMIKKEFGLNSVQLDKQTCFVVFIWKIGFQPVVIEWSAGLIM